MSEWNTLGAKLQRLYDNRQMTLQSAWCYFQPLVRPLDVLSNLCSRVSTRERSTRGSCLGGELINLVYDMMLYNSGDSKVHVLLSKLLKEASRPYMHALYKWLNNGDVDDPYEEFMIVAGAAATESEESHENVHQRAHRHEDTSSTWTNLYMIRHPIPAFIGACGSNAQRIASLTLITSVFVDFPRRRDGKQSSSCREVLEHFTNMRHRKT